MSVRESAATRIAVSPQMTLLIGPGPAEISDLPPRAALLGFLPDPDNHGLILRIVASTDADALSRLVDGNGHVVLAVDLAAFDQYFDWTPRAGDIDCYHVPHALNVIVAALIEDRAVALIPWRSAKAIELLCETVAALAAGALVPHGGGHLSERDARAIVMARRLIDSQWTEKLTLESIARACGINRAKLTRGFRDMYRCTVGEALAERRLAEARANLLATDWPVSTIGYASGYLNNASFTRAFGRRFGLSPTDFRANRYAA